MSLLLGPMPSILPDEAFAGARARALAGVARPSQAPPAVSSRSVMQKAPPPESMKGERSTSRTR